MKKILTITLMVLLTICFASCGQPQTVDLQGYEADGEGARSEQAAEQAAQEPTAEQTTKPVAEQAVQEPTAEQTAKPVAEQAAQEPTADQTTEPTAEQVAQESADDQAVQEPAAQAESDFTVDIVHSGYFTAQYYLSWVAEGVAKEWDNWKYHEVVKDLDFEWDANGSNHNLNDNATIKIPNNAKSITIKVIIKTGMSWKPQSTIIEERLTPGNYAVKIWGTTMSPKGSVTPA